MRLFGSFTSSFKLSVERLAAITALSVLSAGCGPAQGRSSHTAPAGPAPALPASQVEVLQAVDLPTIQIVRRLGDPSDALSIAVFSTAGSPGSVGLAALFAYRLRQQGYQPTATPNRDGLLLLVEVPKDGRADEILAAAYDALSRPVEKSEIQAAQIDLQLRALASRAIDTPSDVGACEGRLASEGAEARTPALSPEQLLSWLERVRAQTVVASRVGIAAVGSGDLLTQVKWLHSRKWAPGKPLDDSWEPGTRARILPSDGGRELRVALRVLDGEHALSAGRALKRPDHSLRHRLRGFSSRFSVSEVDVTLRPAGACLSVHVAIDEASPSSPEQIAGAALLIAQELEVATQTSLDEKERIVAILEPQTALEAAGLAAWSAVRSPLGGAAPARLIEYRARDASGWKDQAFTTRLVELEKKWDERTIPLSARDETGQAELYVMLASPCGTTDELAEEAGLLALTVESLAKQFSDDRGVELIPYATVDAVGLIAHGPKLRGETSREHAARVARSVAGAFSGMEVDGRAVAEARARQLARIGSDPGIALVHSIFGGDHVSMLAPMGDEDVVSALSTTDVERTRQRLAEGPLRLAVLSNAGAGQSEDVERAVAQWLASERGAAAPCVPARLEPAKPGQWSLETIEENVQPGAYVGAFSPVRTEVGHALAYFLTRNLSLLTLPLPADGAESSPAPPPRPGTHGLEVSWLGSDDAGVLLVRVVAPEAELERRVEQVRWSLHQLSQAGISPETIVDLRKEFERRNKELFRYPVGRLIATFSDHVPLPPSARELGVLTQSLSGDQQRIVLLKRRK